MSQLPNSWHSVPLLDVSELIRGVTYSKTDVGTAEEDDYVGVMRANNIQDRRFDLSDLVYVPRRLVADGQYVREGDVVVTTSSGSISVVGKAAQATREMNLGFGAFCGVLRPSSLLCKRFFGHYFSSERYRKYVASVARGVNINNLKRSHFEELNIPLAPLPEQKRIADKLDSLLSRVDSCRERFNRVPAILRRFRQSVLAAATSGKLTEDWRRDRGTSPQDDKIVHALVAEPYKHVCCGPASWELTTLGDVCEFIGGSQPPKSTFVHKDGPGLIRLIQIRDYKSDSHITFIPKSLAKRFCSPTDVMIGRYGPPIFQILRGLEGAYNVALMKARPRTTELDLEYLYVFLRGELLLKYVEAGSDRTAGQSGVRKELLDPYPFFIPPLDEQVEIAKRVATLLRFGEMAQARLDSAQQKIDDLDSAILTKAFRGELVMQDPGDEPASVLFERIRNHKQLRELAKKSTKITKAETGSKRMKKITPESISEHILELPEKSFSFEQLRQKVNGNYEDVKTAVFKLLEKNEIGLVQYFDETAKEMRFTRVTK